MTTVFNPQNVDSEAGFNFELFFEISPDLLCIAGYDGYFKRINPTVSKVLGYTQEELFSRPINDFVYSDDKQITSKNRENLTHAIPLLNFENRYLTKSGEIVWLSWTSVPVDGDKLVFAIAKNITHKKKLEEDRIAFIANLTDVNNDLKQLNYTTSHDLRSPVSNLLSVFSMLDVTKIQDEETLEFIDVLKQAAENLQDTLDNYVDALSGKGSLNVELGELDMEDSLNSVLYSLSSLVRSSRAIITADFSEVKTVKFNKAYLESIFLNLLTNSIKYANPDSIPVISIYSREFSGVHQLIFTDNGLGFDMDKVKDKVFGFNQRFHGNADSKGIGLYLVYNHITSLGGSIVIDSTPNKGTTFTISFKA